MSGSTDTAVSVDDTASDHALRPFAAADAISDVRLFARQQKEPATIPYVTLEGELREVRVFAGGWWDRPLRRDYSHTRGVQP